MELLLAPSLDACSPAGAFGIVEPPAGGCEWGAWRAGPVPDGAGGDGAGAGAAEGAGAGSAAGRALVLAPGAAFGLGGSRVGRGRGYYDAFIARARAGARAAGEPPPLVLGLALSAAVDAERALPEGELDARVDGVVTPAGVRLWGVEGAGVGAGAGGDGEGELTSGRGRGGA